MERRIEKRQIVNIFVLFLIVQFGGLLFAFYTIPPFELSLITTTTLNSSQSAGFLIYIVFVIVAASFILVYLLKRVHGSLLFKGIEAYAIGLPTAFLIFYLLGDIFPYMNPLTAIAIALILAAGFVIAKNRWPTLRNTATVVASIGIGVVIGFAGFYIAYLFIAVIAVYDYVAVFVTKHMQVMARAMAERNMALLIGSSDVEMMPASYVTKSEKKQIVQAVKRQKDVNPVIKKMMKEGSFPTMSQIMLGGGDLALPLVVIVGTYVSFGSLFLPMMLIIGALIGLLLTMWLLQKYKVPLPAIPPLFASMNLFLGIGLFVGHYANAGVAIAFAGLFVAIMGILLLTLKRNQAMQNG